MYRKIDSKEEILDLKKYSLCAWSGKQQRHVIVTIENSEGEKSNRTYYFTSHNEYSRFIRELRKLEI